MLGGCIASQPKISDQVKVTFEGYDGAGKLDYNSTEIDDLVNAAAMKAAGFSDEEIKAFISDEISVSGIVAKEKDLSRVNKVQDILANVKWGFNKTTNLSNKDEVEFTLTYSGEGSSFKDEKKVFEVSGLKKSEKLSSEEIAKEILKAEGYNGFGHLDYPNGSVELESSVANKLGVENMFSNGDIVTYKLSDTYVQELAGKGKIVTDADSEHEFTITGLKEASEISNIEELKSKVTALADESYQAKKGVFSEDSYTFEKVKDFYRYDYRRSNPNLDFATIYKVTKTSVNTSDFGSDKKGEVKTKEYYQILGILNTELKDNQLSITDSTFGKYTGHEEYKTVEEAEQYLTTSEHFKEYK